MMAGFWSKKEEFSLLVFDPPRQLDQRILVEETITSEGSIESQRQTVVARAKGLCRLSSTYQKMLYPLDQDPAPLVVIEATWGLHPEIQFTLLQPKLQHQQVLPAKMVKQLCLWLCIAISK